MKDKSDWFDEHFIVVGENAEAVKEKIKEKLVCKVCKGTGSVSGTIYNDGVPEQGLEPCDNCKGGIV